MKPLGSRREADAYFWRQEMQGGVFGRTEMQEQKHFLLEVLAAGVIGVCLIGLIALIFLL